MRTDYFTVREVANMMEYDDSHVRRMLINDEIKGVKWGNTWMIDAKEVRQLLKRGRLRKK